MYQSWKRVDGSTRYPVQSRTDRDKATVYQESRVFACKHVAVAWAKRRYAELKEARAIGGLPRKRASTRKAKTLARSTGSQALLARIQ